MKLGFIGLGELGFSIAEVFGKYFYTEGYDIKQKNTSKCKYVNKIDDVVNNKDVIFICVETPHDDGYDGTKPVSNLENKDFDYTYVLKVLKEIENIKEKEQTIVLISTVLPGTIRNKIQDKISYDLVYNPFVVCVETVENDLLNPEITIIGNREGKKDNDIFKLKKVYEKLSNVPITLGTWEEAECTKIFYNTFISTKISFTNTILDTTNKIKNCNPDNVIKNLSKCNKRIISDSYLKPGMCDGGPCHPRDNIALAKLANDYELSYNFFNYLTYVKEQQTKNMAKEILNHGKRICIVGKGYKPDSKITQGSPSLLLSFYLCYLGGNVSFYDPNFDEYDLTKNIYVLAYHTKWTDKIDFPSNSIIFDPWREFVTSRNDIDVVYYGL